MREFTEQSDVAEHDQQDTLGALSPADSAVESVTDQSELADVTDTRFVEPDEPAERPNAPVTKHVQFPDHE